MSDIPHDVDVIVFLTTPRHLQPNQETLAIDRDDKDLPPGATTVGGGDETELGEEAVGFGAKWGPDHGDGELVAVRSDVEDQLRLMRGRLLPQYM